MRLTLCATLIAIIHMAAIAIGTNIGIGLIIGIPGARAAFLKTLKKYFFSPSCAKYQLQEDYDALLTDQLQLARRMRCSSRRYDGPPRLTIDQVRTAAQHMQAVNRDASKRKLISTAADGAVYVGFKFWLPGTGAGRQLAMRRGVYEEMERLWPVVRAAAKKRQHTAQPIILCGYGLGGALAVLMAARLSGHRHARTAPIKIITFDDPPMFLKDPDTAGPSGLSHLRFVSPYYPLLRWECEEELLVDYGEAIVLPKKTFGERLSSYNAGGGTIDYALYVRASDTQSVGVREGEMVDGWLAVGKTCAAMATAAYAACRHVAGKRRAEETAAVLAADLADLFKTRGKFGCRVAEYVSLRRPFQIECAVLEQTIDKSLLRFSAKVVPCNRHKRESACCELVRKQNTFESVVPQEACVAALCNSPGVHNLFFSCHVVPVDMRRMQAVVVAADPLLDGAHLLERRPTLFTRLLSPSDPFPEKCHGVITGAQPPHPHPHHWTLVRLFYKSLVDRASSRGGRMKIGQMACKRDTANLTVRRVTFSLDGVSTRVLDVEGVRECLAGRRSIDCTDPINQWIRPTICPKRCTGPSAGKFLCGEVLACGNGMFIAVQKKPLLFGDFESLIRLSDDDRYVAYSLRTREGFGLFGCRLDLYLLISFD